MSKKIVTLGEIMLRLSTPGNTRFVQSNAFDVVYGGGEANVAVSCANYGHEAYFVSKLPKHEIGQGDFPKPLNNDRSGELYYTKISIENFKKLESGQKLAIVTIDSKGIQSEVDNIQITNIYTLNKVEGEELYKLSDEERTKFNGILNKSGIKSDVKSEVDKKTGTEIKPI